MTVSSTRRLGRKYRSTKSLETMEARHCEMHCAALGDIGYKSLKAPSALSRKCVIHILLLYCPAVISGAYVLLCTVGIIGQSYMLTLWTCISSPPSAFSPRNSAHLAHTLCLGMANPQTIPQPVAASVVTPEHVPDFVYESLASPKSSIRVITLQPRTWPGTLKASLRTVTFASRPKYFALSYAWGPPGETKSILLDGKKLEIRKNLHDALLHLRDKTGNHTLWVDAISIDQSNIEERNQQVRLMAYIYTRAQHVVFGLAKFTSPRNHYL